MAQGVIKWFDAQRGFGFIKQDDGGGDIFVHVREVNCSGFAAAALKEGDRVAFDIVPGRREGKSAASTSPEAPRSR